MPLLRDIWQFIAALIERMDKIHMTLIAAGVAFYAMFAVFPGLAAIIALWSLWLDPIVILEYMQVAEEFIPTQAAEILHSQLSALMSTAGGGGLGWASALSILIATVSARAGVMGLINGLNAAYGVRSHSTIFGFLLAYMLTLAILGVVLMGLVVIVVVPVVLNLVPFSPLRVALISYLPWAGMFLIVLIGIGILYRYGPNVKTPRTPLFTGGALFAALAWALASLALSQYLASFSNYNRIYGSIGAVIALLMWFYLAGFSVLLGAVINVELDRRKRIAAARAARREPQKTA
ncbi:MAG: YihY/virulence factor BrkB family protein [Paracoccus sp. (in: a-proteobacteria)]|uniref:YihY/virulence factor BrkB family protein n=1 Tax=Paracoccus sp. TaxID=267 RepID=UPI0026DFBA69|nr:YihY/virulence factor BrkB family protein [Paracoccus sp. (in: a-proteobacteria)]MDO5621638.1 YihY/virulence factor BrkB family protein [Paracoccus sp. (in: a-proteobacteria)]